MQLTGVDLSFLSREFQELVGAKLEKIYQSDEVFLFRFYVPAGGKRELKISLPGSIYYTSYAVVFPREPPKFCQFLRKYLQGGKITRVYQKPFERIIELSFSRKDGNFHLIIELFHDGNIVLCHEDYKIKGLYKSQRFSSRSVRGGVTYEYPPLKFDFTLLEQTPFPKDDLERFLAGTLGLGKVWAKELAHGGSEKEIKEKIESFSSCRIEANASNGIPLPLNFETLPCEKTFATFNEAVDDLFSTKEVKIKQEAQEGSVHSREDKIERTLSSQVDALEKNEEDAVLNNKKGELIFTHQPELEQLFAAFHELRKSLAGKNLEAELKKRFAFVSSFDQKMERSPSNSKLEFMRRYKEMDSSFHLVVDLPTYVRFNPLKADSPSRYFASLRTKGFSFRRVSFLSSGFICEGKRAIGATTPYLQGIFHVQEAASQVPAEVLFFSSQNRRSLLLDMCAAPGGKTSQLAALFQDSSILALDSSSDRMVALHHNLDRLGAAQVVTKLLDARETPSLKLSFDGILLDAPCSGNYAIEKHYFAKRTIAGVKKNSLLQKELIQAAFSSLKSGGVLVYATCSLEPEENEEVVDWFLKKTAGEMRLERIPFREGSPGLTSFQGKSYDSSLALAKRFWPHRHKTQGFFVAAMRRL